MQRIIIGTAGHVDHGKSALAKALTGVDPDRLPEEKARQMTIDLGFVFMPISPGQEVAIIDVPGHESLLKTMIAGANSIRMVLFVVAADEGIMPQTVEHFDVLRLLGVERGIIVITKIDRVQSDYLDLVEDDIKKLVKGSFLEDAPICRLSTTTNEGLAELRNNIITLCKKIEPLPDTGIFRCPIDRIFTIKGFGTIVAGTVVSGRLKISDTVEVLPIRKRSRLRNLQVHNQPVSEVFAGQRVAFNLTDIGIQELVRGYELSLPDYLLPTQIVNGSVSILPDASKALINNERVRLHKGTGETMARAIILDKDKIEPGEKGYVQFRLERPIVGEIRERFIIRSYSPMKVIGGGYFLELYARKGGRYNNERIEYLSKIEKTEGIELVETVIKHAENLILSEKELTRMTNLPSNKITEYLQNMQEQKQVVKLKDNSIVHRMTIEALKAKFLKMLNNYVRTNPIKVFMPIGELMKGAKISNHSFCQMVLEELKRNGKIELTGDGVKIIGLDVKIAPATQKLADEIEGFIIDRGYQLVRLEDLTGRFSKEGPERLKNMISYLSKSEKICEVRENAYLHCKVLDQAKIRLIDYLKEKGSIRAIEFKQLLGVSRDLARDILDYFVEKGITVRSEGTHRLRDKQEC